MNTKANERQVGGGHYKSEYEHWDFVNDTGMDYFQGQFSRYVARARKKNGVEDYEKAIHYAQKAVELCLADCLDPEKVSAKHSDFVGSNALTFQESAAIWACIEGEWLLARQWAETLATTL